jgi:hypothetical protein
MSMSWSRKKSSYSMASMRMQKEKAQRKVRSYRGGRRVNNAMERAV